MRTGILWLALASLVVSLVASALVVAGDGAGRGLPGVRAIAASHPAVRPLDPPAPTQPAVIASVDVGAEPVAAATDTGNGWVYVANSISGTVSVLNGTSLIATIGFTANQTAPPSDVVYDPVNGLVYVLQRFDAETQSGAVNVVSGTTVLTTIPVGPWPNAAVVDPETGDVYVTNSRGSTVSVLSGTSSLGKVTVGTAPCALAYDTAAAEVIVANCGSDNVSALSGTAVVGTVAVGSVPDAVAYDPADERVYVANNGSANVSVLGDLALVGTVPVGTDPTYVLYDPTVGGVEVANTNSSNLSILTGTSVLGTVDVAAGPDWIGLSPDGSFTFVAGAYANAVTVLHGTTLVETLPVGSYPVAGTSDPVTGLVYVVNSGSNNVSVLANAHAVTFNETGLGPGVGWSVSLGGRTNGSESPSIGFYEPAGTYAYEIGVPTGYTLLGASPGSPLTVRNVSLTVNVTFAPTANATYRLTFVETGLSPSCGSHGRGGHDPASDALGLTGGRGGYGGRGGHGGGGGCCMGSGLPFWSVTVDGVTRTTNNTSLTFVEPNGVYAYTIDAPSGYQVASSTPSSPVTVAGANVTVEVTFSRCSSTTELSLTFDEQGLPRGTRWCVTVNDTECGTGSQIVFSGLSPGSYAFNVSAVSGYTARPGSGTADLTDRSVTVTIRFSSNGSHHCGG